MQPRTLILDTETTGFSSSSRVIELGAVICDAQGFELGAFSSLVRPDRFSPGWEKAMAVHGVSQDVLSRAPSPADVWGTFGAWVMLYAPIHSVRAYNVSFDKRMMESTFEYAHQLPWGPCLMRLVAQHLVGANHISLVKACEALGIKGTQTHRALDDARRAAAAWYKVVAVITDEVPF